MSALGLPMGFPVEYERDYRVLQLTTLLFEEFRWYWGGGRKKTARIFAEKNIFEHIMNNYDFYCNVGNRYAVESICEDLGLPKGGWR